MIDSVQFALGDVQDSHARLQIQRPETKLRDPATGTIVGTAATDVPDLIILTGSLPESAGVKKNATLYARYRRGPPFKGEPPFVWTVNGEKAELRLVSASGPSLQADTYNQPVTLEIHDFETDQVTPVEWNWADWQLDIPARGRSIAAEYEAYAAGE